MYFLLRCIDFVFDKQHLICRVPFWMKTNKDDSFKCYWDFLFLLFSQNHLKPPINPKRMYSWILLVFLSVYRGGKPNRIENLTRTRTNPVFQDGPLSRGDEDNQSHPLAYFHCDICSFTFSHSLFVLSHTQKQLPRLHIHYCSIKFC